MEHVATYMQSNGPFLTYVTNTKYLEDWQNNYGEELS